MRKHQGRLLIIPMIMGLFILQACTNTAPSPVPTAVSQGSQPGLAVVQMIEVPELASPQDSVTIVAHGQYLDACTEISDALVERSGEAFVVTLITSATGQADCAAGVTDYQYNVTLDLAGVPAGTYPVVVNGVSADLVIQKEEATSQPVPTPTSEPTALPQPTATPELVITAPTPEASAVVSPTLEVSPEPTALPQPTASPAPTETRQAGCQDEAAFYDDITIPDNTLLQPGESFVKTWRIRNTGTCAWGKGYSLVFGTGDVMNAPLTNPLPSAAPGDIIDVSVNLVAPTRGGQQTGNWNFQNAAGQRFGVGSGGHDYIWVQIQVDYQVPGASPTPPPGGAPTPPPGGSGSGDCQATRNTDYENQVLRLINDVRAKNGLSALTLNPILTQAAVEHSTDMACADFVDHTGSDGSTWYDRVARLGYANYNSTRENIYVGDPAFGGTPDGAFIWWMNSQVHRDNILFASTTDIGIGYMYNPQSSYGGYFTVDFARP